MLSAQDQTVPRTDAEFLITQGFSTRHPAGRNGTTNSVEDGRAEVVDVDEVLGVEELDEDDAGGPVDVDVRVLGVLDDTGEPQLAASAHSARCASGSAL